MKWSPEYLNRVDSNGDGFLDYGYADCRGEGTNVNLTRADCPGAWLTNKMTYDYINDDGETCTFMSFSKMVAVPLDAVLEGGVWYTADGQEIGSYLWENFALLQKIVNDPCGGSQGIFEKYPTPAGFGFWK
jgi:hypothetical protein